ncbi:MAG: sulfotransferase domain-containing protein [Sciscionella sp.]
MGQPVRRYATDMEDSARWAALTFRDGDIVISSPSKAGTTWTQMICALLIFQTPDLPAPLTTLAPWLDATLRPVSEVVARLDTQCHRRFIKTHTPLDGVPDDPRVTYLAICRDPRDVAVSLMFQGENLDRARIRSLVGAAAPPPQSPATASQRSMHDRLLRWMTSDSLDGTLDTLRGFCLQMGSAWSRRMEPNVTLVHYADLSADLDSEMRRLAGRLHIDVPEERWPALVAAAGFDAMRSRSADRAPDEGLAIMHSTDAFFRHGSSGDWREWLTGGDLATYDERVAVLAPPDLTRWMHTGGPVPVG